MRLASELRAELTVAERIGTMVAEDGSAGRCHVPTREAADAGAVARTLSDAAHYLSALHARRPGVVDLAALRPGAALAADWFAAAARGFEGERLYLTRLIVAAGPIPATPGQASTDRAITAQRQAVELLARSDRAGCAIGAAMALVLDWQAVRPLLDAVAQRFDVVLQANRLPRTDATLDAAACVAESPAVERAMLFGASQLLAQHRHLWDLLDTRRAVRQS